MRNTQNTQKSQNIKKTLDAIFNTEYNNFCNREPGMLYFYGGYELNKSYIEFLTSRLPKEIKVLIGDDLNNKGDYFSKREFQQHIINKAGYVILNNVPQVIYNKYPYQYHNLKKMLSQRGYKTIPRNVLLKAKDTQKYCFKYYDATDYSFNFRYNQKCIDYISSLIDKQKIITLKEIKTIKANFF